MERLGVNESSGVHNGYEEKKINARKETEQKKRKESIYRIS